MMRRGMEPNEHTVTSVLAACCPLALGEQIHGYMIKAMGSPSQSIYASTALIDFYSRSSEFDMAKTVFDNLQCKNVVDWCSMMQLHIRDGRPEDALQVFDDMLSEEVVDPYEFALSIALGACGSIALGRQLHSLIIKRDLTTDLRVSNALISMYGRSGLVEELEIVFNMIGNPDLVSWTAASSAYFQNGYGERAIAMLSRVHSKGLRPNDYAFSSVLSSCADLALLHQGRQLHCLALKLGCDSKICTGNALVNMYSKCGQIVPARLAFDVMHDRDSTSWNSLIHAGYAQHGEVDMALEAFRQMCSSGEGRPDESTYLGVLAACNHSGLVNEGLALFRAMAGQHGAAPTPSHYACVVDMLGRSGRFDDALRLIEEMSFEPGVLIWKTLLASCRLHGNLEMGKLAAEKLVELSEGAEDRDSASYVLLSGIHAMRGEWHDVGVVRQRMDGPA
ncbi:Pentatricopeptide repeat-containing protein [Dichanthelium oligosanthes]|uniref:Pentatricopeptide repeat-containing protein n=1 Tax=Dichanthelium oligosanthes TaxID=888268 RepID=A0A1E5W9S9_9POAL|nr:Pentatricopeptide repeat-containing protein [Dichanthelium oligosanthes]